LTVAFFGKGGDRFQELRFIATTAAAGGPQSRYPPAARPENSNLERRRRIMPATLYFTGPK